MKKIFILSLLGLCLAQGFEPSLVMAKQRPLTNDEIEKTLTNPHPPQTEMEKKQVAFAELVIEKLLKKHPDFLNLKFIGRDRSAEIFKAPDVQLNLDESCLKNLDCIQNNKAVSHHLSKIHGFFGRLIKHKNTHVIPWAYQNYLNQKNSKDSPKPTKLDRSRKVANTKMIPNLKKDEYMIHVHAFMEDQDWYHLNVILSEDKDGNFLFRRFYLYKVPRYIMHKLPDGVRC